MKKLFLLFTLLFTTFTYSQYNLEFSKVLNFKLTQGQTATVPAGKVWKIEKTNTEVQLTTTSTEYGSVLNNDGVGSASSGGIVWLAAGTTLVVEDNNDRHFSIIEFNLVTGGSSTGGGTTSDSDGPPSSTIGTDFTDEEDNTYGTTNAAGLIWTTSNASHTTYRDGTIIPQATSLDEMQNALTGRWAYLFYDEAYASYGKLYNFFAVEGKHDLDSATPYKKFAPEGWHVPSYSEYSHLLLHYNSPNSGFSGPGFAKLFKSETGWPDGYKGNNLSGLNIKPYAYMDINGFATGDGVGLMTAFWTSTRSTGDFTEGNILNNSGSAYGLRIGWGSHSINTSSSANNEVYLGNSYSGIAIWRGHYVRLVKDY